MSHNLSRTASIGAILLALSACHREPLPPGAGAAPDAATLGVDAGAPAGQPGEIRCGASPCAAPSFCRVCAGGNGRAPSVTCVPPGGDRFCGPAASLTAFCDGDEDCAAGERCNLVLNDFGEQLSCIPGTCSCIGGCTRLCASLADCEGCGSSCVPIRFKDGTPAHPATVCRR